MGVIHTKNVRGGFVERGGGCREVDAGGTGKTNGAKRRTARW